MQRQSLAHVLVRSAPVMATIQDRRDFVRHTLRSQLLHQVVAAERMVREAGAITLFKSLGVGLEDVAAASLVYDRAMASGRFKPL